MTPFVRFVTEGLRLELSPAWRVLVMVAIDGVQPEQLVGDERELARRLFGDVAHIPNNARRAIVLRLGRGSGKTTLAAALGLWFGLVLPIKVGPGMIPAVAAVAPTKATARIWLRTTRELVRRVPELEKLVVKDGDTADGFALRRADGLVVSFVCVAASRGGATLRGYDLIALVLDESEFLGSNEEAAATDAYAISDRDLFAAARPRLHGPAVFISTPWPAPNLTSELFDRNHGRPETALAAIGESTLMRPDDERLATDVAQALETDPENAKREFFCQSGGRGGSRVFDAGAVDDAVVEGRPLVVDVQPGSTLGIGGDLGLERDS